jgi:uncharacterized protein (DUF1697 family)
VSRRLALLRGINVGKGKPVAMADLAQLIAGLGFAEVRTLLRTGNIVFEAGSTAPAELEALLEREAAARLGLTTDFHVRTADEWAGAISHNPFGREAKEDPAHLVLMTFKNAPNPAAVEALQAAIRDREQVRAWGRFAYLVYPDGIGPSRLTPAMLDRALGRGTGRNWNTVLKLAAMMDS